MPIKPENRGRYPKDWKQIRERILKRADNRCEFCRAENHTRIARGAGEFRNTYMTGDAQVFCANTGRLVGLVRMDSFKLARMVDVVLTIAHLDHVPENCSDDNLKALCQRCHLTYDALHHAKNAAVTRRLRKAVAELF